MDGPHVAKVAFRSTKNCLISVPQQWIASIHAANSLMIFEVEYEGDQKAYFSWSGEYSAAHGQTAGQWSVDINGFYALKLGLHEGQEILVTRKTTPATSLESVRAEPVAVDDWEILEIHANYVQNNLMNQVRVVWNDQLLPIWVNQSVCILVKISGLEPSCLIGTLEQLTDVIVAPKSRADQKSDARSAVAISGPVGPTGEHLGPKDPSETSWTMGGVLGNVFGGWFAGKEGAIGPNDDHPSSGASGLYIYSSDQAPGPVVLRVHPLDASEALDELAGNSPQTLLGALDLRMLLSQPTTVVTTAQSIGPWDRSRPVVIGEMTGLRPAPEEKETEKDQGPKKSQKAPKPKKAPDLFVKVVLLDVLYDYVKDSAPGCAAAVSALGRLLTPGAVLVPQAARRLTGCEVTSRVRLRFDVPEALRTTALTAIPLRGTVEKNAELSIQKHIRLWLQATSALSCPLVATDGMLVEAVTEEGSETNFIVQCQEAGSKGEVKGQPLLVTPSVRVDLRMDACVDDQAVIAASSEVKPVGTKGAALGGIAQNLHLGLLYLKTILRLGPLSQHLVHPACTAPSGGGVLVCGARGSGKTTLAGALCRELREAPHFVHAELVACRALKGKRVESVVGVWRRAYLEARHRSPSVVVLDDLEALVGAPKGPENEVGGAANHQTRLAEALYDILKEASISAAARVATVGTCGSLSALHKSLASPQGVHLFQQTLTIATPDAEQRREMLKSLVLSKPVLDSGSLDAVGWRPLAGRTEGFLAQDLDALVDRAAHAAVADNPGQSSESGLLLSDVHLERALQGFQPASLRGLDLQPLAAGAKGWDDVGGLDDVKQALVETLQWPTKYPVLFAKCPLPMRSGILLYGPPGTGKTLLAGVVARECGMRFISIKGPELLSKYIGASEQAVRDLFEKATNAKPCIIFFDEFDSLAPRRGHDSTGVTDRVVNQLLTQLDGVEGREGVYVLAATSRPDLIDPALLRPGRLDKSLYCPLPLSEERQAILRALGRAMALAEDVSWSAVAEECRHFSGADLQGLLYNAQLRAIHRMQGKGPAEKSPDCLRGDQGLDDFVNVAHPEVTPDPQLTMVHLHKLEDGPAVVDAATSKAVKQQLDAISSSLFGCPTATGQSEVIRPPVMVTQRDLMEAIEVMTPSVSPSDRQRYRDIYHKFIKSKNGQFQIESSAAKRATLA